MGLFNKKDKERKEEEARSQLFGSRPSAGGEAGGNPYGGAPPPPYQQQQQPASTGYGGYGQTNNAGGGYGQPARGGRDDAQRDALFSSRTQQPQRPVPESYRSGGSSVGGYSSGGNGYDNAASSYGREDRQLTAEEEEEEDVEAIKQQIRFTKQESVSSTRNALRIAAQAEETGRDTLQRLGTQGERLYNTEKNLDVASAHNRVAEERARELKTLNRSMFHVHVNNPMKSKARAAEAERKILEEHQSAREARMSGRDEQYRANQQRGNALGKSGPGGYVPRTKGSAAERSRYQFEGDESDDEKEREIHDNLDQLAGITGRLKGLAVATGQEVDRQNKQIGRIMQKSDNVDDQIAITHNRIKKIN